MLKIITKQLNRKQRCSFTFFILLRIPLLQAGELDNNLSAAHFTRSIKHITPSPFVAVITYPFYAGATCLI